MMRLRRTNALLGVVALAAALLVLANAAGLLPPGVVDLIARGAPALLIVFGLALILRDRVPFSGAIALLATAVFVVVVAFSAFSSRAGELRADVRQPILQTLPPEIALLRMRVETGATGVELVRALGTASAVTGEFTGPAGSGIDITTETAADNSTTIIVRQQTRAGDFPLLTEVGRGALRLELPADLLLDIDFVGADGDVALNLSGLSLERLNANVARGDIIATLPEHAPVLTQPGDSLGTLNARDGDVTLFVPDAVAGRFELDRGGSGVTPEYDPARYLYLVGDILEARGLDNAAIVTRYTLLVPRGSIRVQAPGT